MKLSDKLLADSSPYIYNSLILEIQNLETYIIDLEATVLMMQTIINDTAEKVNGYATFVREEK